LSRHLNDCKLIGYAWHVCTVADKNPSLSVRPPIDLSEHKLVAAKNCCEDE